MRSKRTILVTTAALGGALVAFGLIIVSKHQVEHAVPGAPPKNLQTILLPPSHASTNPPAQTNLAALLPDDPVQLLISGTEGHAVIVNNQLYYQSKKVPGAEGKEPYNKLPAGPPAPLHQFVDAVAGQKNQALVTPREAASRVSVMEAMYKSVRDRKWVKPT